jgi:hypothetical protein
MRKGSKSNGRTLSTLQISFGREAVAKDKKSDGKISSEIK